MTVSRSKSWGGRRRSSSPPNFFTRPRCSGPRSACRASPRSSSITRSARSRKPRSTRARRRPPSRPSGAGQQLEQVHEQETYLVGRGRDWRRGGARRGVVGADRQSGRAGALQNRRAQTQYRNPRLHADDRGRDRGARRQGGGHTTRLPYAGRLHLRQQHRVSPDRDAGGGDAAAARREDRDDGAGDPASRKRRLDGAVRDARALYAGHAARTEQPGGEPQPRRSNAGRGDPLFRGRARRQPAAPRAASGGIRQSKGISRAVAARLRLLQPALDLAVSSAQRGHDRNRRGNEGRT